MIDFNNNINVDYTAEELISLYHDVLPKYSDVIEEMINDIVDLSGEYGLLKTSSKYYYLRCVANFHTYSLKNLIDSDDINDKIKQYNKHVSEKIINYIIDKYNITEKEIYSILYFNMEV